MKDTMRFIRKALLTSFREGKPWIFAVAIPVVGLLLSSVIYGGTGSADATVGIVNRDVGQRLATDAVAYIEALEGVATRELAASEAAEVGALLNEGELAAVLTFPEGFAAGLVGGAPPSADLESSPDSLAAKRVAAFLDAYIGQVASLGLAAQGDEAAFNAWYDEFRSAEFGVTTRTVEDDSASRAMARQSVGYLLFLMLFSAVHQSSAFLREKEHRTYFRILASPASPAAYVVANAAVNFLVLTVQIAVMLFVMGTFFRMDPGVPFWQLFLLLQLFALTAIGASLAIVSIAGSSLKVGAMQNAIFLPTSLIAGCMFPTDAMPEALKRIAEFLPQHWLLETLESLQRGSPLGDLTLNFSILLAFAAALTLVAVYRFGRNDTMRSFY
ncbi:ABC transporter permease [Paenibacillus antri]|uniref:ABC transporter permease n=1 Tax=Paenibacillus antri TaxID=2582848 RepID=A0A5R9G4H8_9BACL|nr:ABC transporter permease [Paenibacillus antri]TLS49040.1 ABC transporter permease [Paenibacillus antri]